MGLTKKIVVAMLFIIIGVYIKNYGIMNILKLIINNIFRIKEKGLDNMFFNRKKRKERLEREKRERDTKAKLEIKKTLSKMKRQSTKLEKSKNEYLVKAREAKRNNNNLEYNVLKTGLKAIIKRKQSIDVMIAQFESSFMISEVNDVVGDFVSNTKVLADLMKEISSTTDITEAQLAYESAVGENLGQFEALNMFLETASDNLETMSDFGDDITDDEIDKLINSELMDEEDSIDKEIEEKLEKVRQTIKE